MTSKRIIEKYPEGNRGHPPPLTRAERAAVGQLTDGEELRNRDSRSGPSEKRA